MQLAENNIYHIYNQGNNKELLFYKPENYVYFLRKFRKYILPYTSVLAYALMPNHFHFLVYTTDKSIKMKKTGGIEMTALADGFRQLLSSYTQAINKQENRTGSLFRQKTKAKCLTNGGTNYPFVCFHYIHQNPMTAGLVDRMEEWPFSSFQDYCATRNGTLCDKELAFDLINLSRQSFYEQSYQVIAPEKVRRLFV
ncbi:Putative transposase [Fulvivirga imtechensis AK7]|uniref:Putative transposase n=1 Tax=Fulvivirga imtechensis AK7 TaxID=1237149 RepID=L8JGS3_9BACT|nr:hypothetical protein [Fulvivirga imtechensis]ELR68071.1 Putative transposase [Fulvivirga imtechensis AK7]